MARELDVTITITRAPWKRCLSLLEKGGIAGVVCLSTVMDAYLRERPDAATAIRKVDPPIQQKPYYLVFSHQFDRRHPGLATRIWDTLATIMASERYSQITSRYLR